jgi:superfamily II DNA or RNA helicase
VINLRPYQEAAIEDIRKAFASHRRVLLTMPTGAGKCLGKGTPVLMYDGTIKPVEDVAVGDLLMGPDSRQREVVSLARGREEMFRLTPVKGDPFECNRSHILSLSMTPARPGELPRVVNISVDEYLSQTQTFKHRAKLWRASVDFDQEASELPLPAYHLGLWLGDGNQRQPTVHCPDEEVLSAWDELVELHPTRLHAVRGHDGGCAFSRISRTKGSQQENAITRALRDLGLMDGDGGKFIPDSYKRGSRATRLGVLAGLLDTDGYLHNGHYEISTMFESLNDDILFVARSLGYAAYSSYAYKKCQTGGGGWYWRITISGDFSELPIRVARKKPPERKQIKRVNVTGFSIESLGEGDYYGFEISGPDRLFLLGDFTVTHNTVCFSYVSAGTSRAGKRVLIIAHRRELLKQISAALKSAGVRHAVMTGGYRGIPTAQVVVASVFTLAKRIAYFPAPDLIVGDEAHHFTPDSTWGKVVNHFPKARVLGVTATPERLDGKGLGLMFDHMVMGPPVAELMEQGYLSRADVYAPSVPLLTGARTRMGDYVVGDLEDAMDKPSITGSAVEHYRKLADGKKAIAFCVSIKHAKDVAEQFRQAGYAAHHIDGGMDERERDRVLKRFEDGEIQVLTSCDLVSEGFDLPAIEVGIMLRPTKSLGLFLQQAGRCVRPSPGKTGTIILDHAGNTHRHGFIDEPRDWQLTDGSVREKRDVVPSVRTCPKCFAAHRPMPVCPKCGHAYELKSRKVDHVDGELELTSRSDDVQKASAENDIQRRFSVLKSIGKSRKYGNPERWAFNVICGQEAARLSKMRDPVNRSMVNGLTEEERSAIWNMTMGRPMSLATASP